MQRERERERERKEGRRKREKRANGSNRKRKQRREKPCWRSSLLPSFMVLSSDGCSARKEGKLFCALAPVYTESRSLSHTILHVHCTLNHHITLFPSLVVSFGTDGCSSDYLLMWFSAQLETHIALLTVWPAVILYKMETIDKSLNVRMDIQRKLRLFSKKDFFLPFAFSSFPQIQLRDGRMRRRKN